MAEDMVAPANRLYKLPDAVTDEEGALVEPLSVAVHAARLGRIQMGDRVAVVGDGTIGLRRVMAARAAGASEVYLVAKYKKRGKNKALSIGATKVIYPADGDAAADIAALTDGLQGVDVAIECVGRPGDPRNSPLSLVRKDGIAVMVGVFRTGEHVQFWKPGLQPNNGRGKPHLCRRGPGRPRTDGRQAASMREV